MRVAVEKIFEVKQNQGEHILKIKSDLFKAKQDGIIFFNNDVASLTEKEDINIYYSEFSGMDDDRNAFPIPIERFVLPKEKKERFSLFKKHYESYYPNSEMDYNLFESFDNKPFKAKKCVWFFRQEG